MYYMKQPGGLLEFEKMWRRQFIETMQPQYLPYLWSVDHKPERMGSLEIWVKFAYRKNQHNSDTQNICCSHPKIWTRWLYRKVMHSKDADGIANSVVWFGSALFAQAYLSENLGSLR